MYGTIYNYAKTGETKCLSSITLEKKLKNF